MVPRCEIFRGSPGQRALRAMLALLGLALLVAWVDRLEARAAPAWTGALALSVRMVGPSTLGAIAPDPASCDEDPGRDLPEKGSSADQGDDEDSDPDEVVASSELVEARPQFARPFSWSHPESERSRSDSPPPKPPPAEVAEDAISAHG